MFHSFVTRRSSKTANHPYPTRSNQRRQMEQIQEQMAEMRVQLTEQINAQMAQFMEALVNVTKGQDDLRVLVENSRRVENGGHSRLFDDVSGRIDDHHDPNEFDRLGGQYNPFNQNHGFPPPSRLLGRRDN